MRALVLLVAIFLAGCDPLFRTQSCSPSLDVQSYAGCGWSSPRECDYPDGTKCICVSLEMAVFQCSGPPPDASLVDLASREAGDLATPEEDGGVSDGGAD